MRQRPKALGFVSLLTLLVALDVATPLEAVSRSRQCRKACREQIASCVGAGGRPRACRRRVLGRCKREGVAACRGEAFAPSTTTTTLPGGGSPAAGGAIRTVFLIVMENTDWADIEGSSSAPYINNTLLPLASRAEQYYNPPNMHPSLPNYLWLEAGTNFSILDDNLPSQNQQSTTSHLVTMLEAAGISWKTYQEDEGSGAWDGSYCPAGNDGNWYDVNHNPFAYFTDITSRTARCHDHVRPYSEFPTDLASNMVPRYNFIVPDLCHDMHENISCSQSNRVRFGDTWLSTEVPKILASPAYLDNGALFITWDEAASNDGPIGMIVLSPKAKRGYSNSIAYDHGSTLRTLQEIFGVSPMLRGAATATDLSDLFVSFP